MESEVKDVWYTDYSGVLACVTSVALFSRCWPIADFFASKLNALFRRGKTEDEEISKLEEELNEERRQLGLLSPTAQFAAYFKKERRVNKLNMQYKALGKFTHFDGHFYSAVYLYNNCYRLSSEEGMVVI
ncbi:unnamed protein product [Toxocara canis]|uniref:WASH-7_C domain-containing protein n=1 Tax=Toxocara canis TaxID=6265 RepID=A0A183VGW4_TOXCA|nr:unnamed protein product [Toxocara canis]